MYAKYIKRLLDFCLSLCALIVLSPILLVLTVLGALMMKGNPFFTQLRPGKDEKIFKLIKFRTMTCEKDKDGNLLSDDKRLTKYGKFLRSTSLDELPELFNILKGDMAVVGPRPQLVRDMVFMTARERARHTVRPGLSGLAQVNGRNAIAWESKLQYDLTYIENITFCGDISLIIQTIFKVFKREDISEEGMETAEDLGDYLLRIGSVEEGEYQIKQQEAKELMGV
ncbi:MAG: sugar transferase [Clostridia bacterium]|nr:sugar transferase [Clostridia bacterium]